MERVVWRVSYSRRGFQVTSRASVSGVFCSAATLERKRRPEGVNLHDAVRLL